jgi:two-component system response regulator (stage 0 sporulation protein A)
MNKTNDKAISNMLLDMGILPHYNGYKYAKTAIELLLIEPNLITRRKVTKELYPGVAAIHQTTWTRVERSIRHAIEQAHKTMTARYRHVVGRYNPSAPSCSMFLAQCAEVLRLDMAS